MNYENASNLEIAIKVAKVKKLDWQISAVDGDAVMVDYEVFDPCENPEDAWPIIVDNQISIIPPVSNGTNGWKAERFYCENYGKIIDCIDKNPLRAAMIVFLMMQEEA